MAAVNPKIVGGGAIGPQVVGDHPMWNEAVFLQEFAHQLQRRMLVSPRLHQHIEDFAFGVDGSPTHLAPSYARSTTLDDRRMIVGALRRFHLAHIGMERPSQLWMFALCPF